MALLPRARAAGVSLNWLEPHGVPPVWFDPDRLTQVAVNLIENALKFTPRGGTVDVTLNVEQQTPAAGVLAAGAAAAVRLSVSDNGPGIDPSDLPRATERFFRGRGAAAIPGTGLGLAIVAAILQRSGGELSIQSELGRGTTAVACLPVAGREER